MLVAKPAVQIEAIAMSVTLSMVFPFRLVALLLTEPRLWRSGNEGSTASQFIVPVTTAFRTIA
jgi:hypothetical protein